MLNKFHCILILSLVAIVLSSPIILSYADYTSPRKQIELGVLPEDIQCRENRVLVIRDNGNPVCVQESTADKMNWNIIATEFVQKEIAPNNAVQIDDKVENMKDTNDLIGQHESITDNKTNNNDELKQEQEFIVLDLGSDVEYVDDGRKTHVGFQRSPAPDNIYERIIDNQEDNNIDPHGNMRVPVGFAHEKYSIVDSIGLYPADWMPTYIPDGYKLLFFENFNYEDTTGDAVLRINFVPNTFVVNENTTNYDLKHNTHGFTINVMRDVLPMDQIEDVMEYFKESMEQDPEYEGRWLDVTRDGKTVWASETQSYYNHYQAGYSFSPDDYTSVGVTSYHMTLEELEPIFNSVMN